MAPSTPRTVIGPSVSIRGKVKSDEDLVIRGRIDASISSTKLVHVDADGIVKADIDADSVIISGIVVGAIIAVSRLELLETARVVGDISSPIIVISDGARLRGTIDMTEVDQAMEQPYVESTASPARAQVAAPAEVSRVASGAAVPNAPSPSASTGPIAAPAEQEAQVGEAVATTGQANASRPTTAKFPALTPSKAAVGFGGLGGAPGGSPAGAAPGMPTEKISTLTPLPAGAAAPADFDEVDIMEEEYEDFPIDADEVTRPSTDPETLVAARPRSRRVTATK